MFEALNRVRLPNGNVACTEYRDAKHARRDADIWAKAGMTTKLLTIDTGYKHETVSGGRKWNY